MEKEDLGVGELRGHPAEGLSGGESAVVKPEKVEGEGQGEIAFGNHRFKTVAELTSAYENLEKAYGDKAREVGELRTLRTDRIRPEGARTARSLDFKKLGDTIIENPEAAVKELTSYVDELVETRVSGLKETIKVETSEVDREKRLWDKFFNDNPWLEHRRREVEVVSYNVLWPEIAGKPPEEQFKRIAEHFKGATERSAMVLNGREMPGRAPSTAATTSPSGVSSKAPQVDSGSKPKSFVESVKAQSYVPKVAGS